MKKHFIIELLGLPCRYIRTDAHTAAIAEAKKGQRHFTKGRDPMDFKTFMWRQRIATSNWQTRQTEEGKAMVVRTLGLANAAKKAKRDARIAEKRGAHGMGLLAVPKQFQRKGDYRRFEAFRMPWTWQDGVRPTWEQWEFLQMMYGLERGPKERFAGTFGFPKYSSKPDSIILHGYRSLRGSGSRGFEDGDGGYMTIEGMPMLVTGTNVIATMPDGERRILDIMMAAGPAMPYKYRVWLKERKPWSLKPLDLLRKPAAE